MCEDEVWRRHLVGGSCTIDRGRPPSCLRNRVPPSAGRASPYQCAGCPKTRIMILVCAPSLHRNRLGQVAGLVYVTAFDGGYVVGQELEGDDGQQGDEAFFGVGDFYGVVGQVADDGVAAGNYSDYPTLPGFDFVDVADHLIIHGLVVGGYHYHRHFLVYEGDGPVLHLGGGIPLGMDV